MRYKFDDIAYNITQKRAPQKEDSLKYIGLEHLDSGSITVNRYGLDVDLKGDKLVMKKGDILLGKRNAYLRRAAIAPHDGLFSAHGMVLRPKEDVIYKDYFPFFISSDRFFDELIRISVGGLSPTVNWRDLKELEFELPSLDQQKVLAEKLWAAYDVKQSYLRMIAATEEMVKSQFIEEYYVEKKYLQQLRPHVMVIRGVSYKPSDIKEKGGLNSVILLRSNNIDNGRINFDDVVNVDSDRVSENQVLQHGDIVMCGSNGSKKLVGKAAMIDVMPENRCSFGAFCLGIRCKKTIHPKFLSTFFQTSIYREVIESLGAGSNILNIKPDHIYDLMVPVPPLDKQQMFVSIVEQADKSEFDGFKSQFIEEYYGEKKNLKQLRPHVMVIRGVSYKPSDIKEEGASNRTVLLRSNNIDNGRINFDDVVCVNSERVSESQVLQPGDIVMCGSNGSKKLVGKAAMMEVMPKYSCSFGAFCLGIRCKETIHPKYLSTFFQTSTYREIIESLGAGSNILNIKPNHIYDLMVPVPPMNEQKKFVSIVQQADKSENHCEFRMAS